MPNLTLSCAFATSNASHEHAAIAERLGYERAWFYDSPALYPDVWVQMSRAAERTERIGLGPAVLVPNLRHPMTNAAAVATLVDIAGADRVAVAIGSGFTGRLTLGQRPLPWRYVRSYVEVLRGLLAGDTVEWEGKPIRMLQPAGFGAPRPIDVPFLIAAGGPKGTAAARDIGHGVFTTAPSRERFDWNAVLTFGTVLEDGEDPGSERALAAAGHAASVNLHGALEFGAAGRMPGGAAWAAAYDDVPRAERHLALHEDHLIAVNERDAPFVTGELLAGSELALSRDAWREKLAQMEGAGGTEVVYQPAGPDITRELEAFASLFS